MNPAVKEKWVAALRSGDYRQNQGQLHADVLGGHCCLGVLCEVGVKEGVIEGYPGGAPEPPPEVKEWSGLTSAPVIFKLQQMNDRDRWNFDRIADYIERNL